MRPRGISGSLPEDPASFKFRWRQLTDAGVTASSVVEGLDEVEDGELGLGVGLPPGAVDELAL
jgi:hypothetical protein